LDVPLEKCLIQNQKREKWKQIPEIIIKTSFDKIEKKFENYISLKTGEKEELENLFNELLIILKDPVIIKNDLLKTDVEYEKNFSHLLDIFCREKIGLFNKSVLIGMNENIKKKTNKKISEFKFFYQDFTNFILYHNDDLDYDEQLSQKQKKLEQIFCDNQKIDFRGGEEKIKLLIRENKQNSNLDLIESQAEILSNYFQELLNNLFIN